VNEERRQDSAREEEVEGRFGRMSVQGRRGEDREGVEQGEEGRFSTSRVRERVGWREGSDRRTPPSRLFLQAQRREISVSPLTFTTKFSRSRFTEVHLSHRRLASSTSRENHHGSSTRHGRSRARVSSPPPPPSVPPSPRVDAPSVSSQMLESTPKSARISSFTSPPCCCRRVSDPSRGGPAEDQGGRGAEASSRPPSPEDWRLGQGIGSTSFTRPRSLSGF